MPSRTNWKLCRVHTRPSRYLGCTHNVTDWAVARKRGQSLRMALRQLDMPLVDHLLDGLDRSMIVFEVELDGPQWGRRLDNAMVSWRRHGDVEGLVRSLVMLSADVKMDLHIIYIVFDDRWLCDRLAIFGYESHRLESILDDAVPKASGHECSSRKGWSVVLRREEDW